MVSRFHLLDNQENTYKLLHYVLCLNLSDTTILLVSTESRSVACLDL